MTMDILQYSVYIGSTCNIFIGICYNHVRCWSLTRYYTGSTCKCTQELAVFIPMHTAILVPVLKYDSTQNCALLGCVGVTMYMGMAMSSSTTARSGDHP